MKFVKHPQHTSWLGAPPAWDHDKIPCGALSIRGHSTNGYPVMESAWEPEEAETLGLALGVLQLRLGVISMTHPPVSMHTDLKDGVTTPQVRENLEKLLKTAFEYAEREGWTIRTGYCRGRLQVLSVRDEPKEG